jgi:hypothetical protein
MPQSARAASCAKDFKDHVFRFQILDEAQELGRDWHDALGELLASRE